MSSCPPLFVRSALARWLLRWPPLLAVAVLATLPTQAVQITQVSPQGEVAQVRQVVVRFASKAVNFGDTQAPAPAMVRCSDVQAGAGDGRWNNEREWVFNFHRDLPPGVRCQVERDPAFKPADGSDWTGTTRYSFSTGGPFVRHIAPYEGSAIDEEQAFILTLNGPATTESLRANLWCVSEGVGERIPVRLIEGEERAALLATRYLTKAAAAEPGRYATLSCNRRLASASKLQLVYGQGVATPSGLANKIEKRFDYVVREPFKAEFSCERENANSGCLPIRPLELRFNAPVPRKLAEGVRLNGPDGPLRPVFDAEESTAPDALVEWVRFVGPLAERASYTLTLPDGLQDAAGRSLVNAASFPLTVATGPMPPLAKFATGRFGVVERLAEGPDGPALLPLTVRRIEGQPAGRAVSLAAGAVQQISPATDADIIAWYRKLERYDTHLIERERARADVQGALPAVVDEDYREWVETRMLSLLDGQRAARSFTLPAPTEGEPRPFEVIGLPLQPGFHVLEVGSPLLGQALLNPRHGAQRTMYVRTSALVTNLAVHFKLGREGSLAWVTSLDKGRPVAGAQVQISDCNGHAVAQAVTDQEGLARFAKLNSQPPSCSKPDEWGPRAYFVSARATGADGVADLAFTWSHWQRGIEPWRFNVPTSSEPQPDTLAHTLFDRTLLRAGDTVSMKHLLRTQTAQGFGLPDARPTHSVIVHVGSGQEFSQPLNWRETATGGRSAESQFTIPAAAKLGQYNVFLGTGERSRNLLSGQFHVEEFRLPVLQGQLAPVAGEAGPALVALTRVPVQVQVNYVNGGPASGLPVRVSALLRPTTPRFSDYEDFSFAAPRAAEPGAPTPDDEGGQDDEGEEAGNAAGPQVVADKLALTLDAEGTGRTHIESLPASPSPRTLLLEASYADPNGEVQTLRHASTLWPASVVAAIRTEGWVSVSAPLKFHALALDTSGQPKPGAALAVKAQARITTTTRKRLVGGFYSYDSTTEVRDLGTVCTGQADARGLLLCSATLKEAGEVELVVTATDAAGKTAQAATSVWVTRQDELWFGGRDDDRMDVLPEKRRYEPGETARLQVRMPFRQATALVAVEREGILETQVVELSGKDPSIALPIKAEWGPNVYVSVLALRGRVQEVPWYSFFTWGYKAPRDWWRAFWQDSKEAVAPTAMIDLSKPAFRLGMAELKIGHGAHEIKVAVSTDQPSYPVRGTAKVTVRATLPGGQPAAGAEVALAAVDQALLELMPNNSWKLLDAMMASRAWGVSTATAQMEVVGRRHYGRKALPAGGGGGKSPTRELLDTLLLWRATVPLDAQGQAQIEVPLNDALTAFRIVAVADAGTGYFGTGEASITARQDLQIIHGLPPLVRTGDAFRAQVTLRNTTSAPMQVELTPGVTPLPAGLSLAAQQVDIPAGQARELTWNVTVPADLAERDASELAWTLRAKDTRGGAEDALAFRQRVLPALPLAVQQATLVQVDPQAPYQLDVAPPASAQVVDGAARGGLHMSLVPTLASGLPGVRDWFRRYPYTCLEQTASQALGLGDRTAWQKWLAGLPAYLDTDGLAAYFPLRGGDAQRGSDTLTAYLLAASHEAARLDPALAIPEAVRAPMERGLIAFAEGRIERRPWSPRNDLTLRKLAAIEALSRYGKAQPRMLESLTIAPNQWPTHAVIDWLNILRQLDGVPQRAARQSEAEQVLRARLHWQGSKLVFSTEQDDAWWWLMQSGDVNSARLVLTALDLPEWKDELPRMAAGFIARQQSGAWHTTTANLWGSLALRRFARQMESGPVAGQTQATLDGRSAQVDWAQVARAQTSDAGGENRGTFTGDALGSQWRGNTMQLPWPAGDAAHRLSVSHTGSGKPWLTLQSLAAVPRSAPLNAGYAITRKVEVLKPANPALPAGEYTRGDIVRITLDIDASADMTWVAITDPVPAGATVLGSGLGRDSAIATLGERRSGAGWLAYEERSFEAFRSYYEYLPKGKITLQYTVRLNNVGRFQLPPTRVEALYAPEMFGEAPNAPLTVQAAAQPAPGP